MKIVLFLITAFFISGAAAQVNIHAHNDYEKPKPFFNAIKNEVYSIEADVFLVNDQLLVAHTIGQVDSSRTLFAMYIRPIIQLFQSNHGFISKDSSYKTILMIDVKHKGKEVIQKLVSVLQPWQKYFDRQLNPNAIEIVISGDRGTSDDWKNYPSFIYFDGRPYESYDSSTLKRIAMISDDFAKYASLSSGPREDQLLDVIKNVHGMKKPIRFWAAPDDEKGWTMLHRLGVDIINTDKIDACRIFFGNE